VAKNVRQVVKEDSISIALIASTIVYFLGIIGVAFGFLLPLFFIIWLIGFLIVWQGKGSGIEDTKGNNQLLKITSRFSQYGVFIRLFPLVAGIGFALSGKIIANSTKLFFDFQNWSNYSPDIPIFMFWTLLIIWVIMLPMYLTDSDKVNFDRFKEIQRSIHSSPDLTLLRNYPELYTRLRRRLVSIEKSQLLDIEKAEAGIQLSLKVITELVKYFSPYSDETENIGANIWMIFNKYDQPDLFETLPSTISFNTTFQQDDTTGVILLVSKLILSDEPNFKLDEPIILPIPSNHVTSDFKIALPGAPWAALDGMSVFNNIDDLEQHLMDFKAQTRDEVLQYFKSGNGEKIKSFASFRIGDESNPIGVVNIDSIHLNLLGDSQFLDTFLTLFEPIKHELGMYVQRYAGLFIDQKKFPWVSKSKE